jgi:hypothetical protein
MLRGMIFDEEARCAQALAIVGVVGEGKQNRTSEVVRSDVEPLSVRRSLAKR